MRYYRFIGGSHDGRATIPWMWNYEFPPGQKKELKVPELKLARVTLHPDDDLRGSIEVFPVETYTRRWVTLASNREIEAFVEESLWNTEVEEHLLNKLFEIADPR